MYMTPYAYDVINGRRGRRSRGLTPYIRIYVYISTEITHRSYSSTTAAPRPANHTYIHTYINISKEIGDYALAFTRYCFTPRPMCTNQSSSIAPPHPHCPHYCTTMHDYCAIYDPPPTPLLYAIHHTILVMAISCESQITHRSYSSTTSALRPLAAAASAYMYIYIYTQIHIHIQTYIHINITEEINYAPIVLVDHRRAAPLSRRCPSIYLSIYTYIYTYIHTYTYIYTYIHTHICIQYKYISISIYMHTQRS